MKRLYIFLLMCLPFFAMAQNNFHRWQIGTTFSSECAYRTSPETTLASNSEIPKLGFTAGLSTVYNFTSFLGLETGIFFSNRGFFMGNVEIDYPVAEGKWRYTFTYIDVPIRTNIYLGKGKLRGIATAGIMVNFVQYRGKKWVSRGGLYSITDMLDDFTKKNKFSPLIGIGIENQLSNKITLRVLPILKYGLKETFIDRTYWHIDGVYHYSEEISSRKLWNLGVEVGVFYTIF